MNQKYKVAFATNDGVNIFSHFGRAKYFEVFKVENGEIKIRERRDKPDFHSNTINNHHNHESHQARHNIIFSMREDCEYIVAGGMGYGIYDFLTSNGKHPIVTSVKSIDEALSLLIENKLENHTEKLH